MMKILFVSALCLCVLFVLPSFAQKKTAKTKKTKQSATIEKPNLACDYPPIVNSVEVSKKEIAFCPLSDIACLKDSIIEVSTHATDMEDGSIYFLYTVSGGKIIGEGARVKWDLSGVPPGTYTITVGIPDRNGNMYVVTKTEVVKVIQ